MDLRDVLTIPNFDNHRFQNVSWDDAERIYSSPRIRQLVRTIGSTTLEPVQDGVFLDITNEIAKQSGSAAHVFTELTRTRVREHKAKLCLIDRDASPSYRNIHVLGDLNQKPAEAGKELARHAREIFAKQHFRQRLFAFTLCATKMRTLMFARDGIYSSGEFDIVLNPVRFVRVLASFLRMTRSELGYDPACVVNPGGKQTLTMANDRVYQLESCIYSSVNFSSRATCIMRGMEIGSAATLVVGESVVIKDSWQKERRREEGELLRQVASSEAPLFPEWYVLKRGHHIRDWPARRRWATYVHHETVKGEKSVGVWDRSGRRTGPVGLNHIDEGPSEKSPREHRRVVVEYLECKRLEDLINTPLDLFTAVRDCIDGHWALYRAGVLHRDVSKDNLMVAVNEDKLDFGFIIDLDFAAEDDLSTRAGHRQPFATGNKQFMAREVLKWLSDCQRSYNIYQRALRYEDSDDEFVRRQRKMFERHSSRFKQEYRHDLESFYWVLLWCLFQMTPGGKLNMTDTFNKWKDPGRAFKDVLHNKYGYFIEYRDEKYFTDLVGLDSATAEVTFESLLVSLTKVLSDAETLAALPAEELYCRFQRGLTEIIEFLKARLN